MTELSTIWIVGTSWVYWLERYARSTGNPNLSLPGNVVWLGRRGMKWSQLLPLLEAEKGQRDAPHLLCIHCGANDLGYSKGTELIHKIRSDLVLVMSLFPGAHIVFSNLCERRVWMHGTCGAPGGINKTRRNVNKVVDSFLRDVGMSSVRHDNLRRSMAIYRRDGVHLNDTGNAVFMANLIGHLQNLL